MMHTKDQKWFQQRNRKGIHWEIGIFQDIMQIILSVHGIIIKQFNQTIVAPKHQMFNWKFIRKIFVNDWHTSWHFIQKPSTFPQREQQTNKNIPTNQVYYKKIIIWNNQANSMYKKFCNPSRTKKNKNACD